MEHSNPSSEEIEALSALLAGKAISNNLCQSLQEKGFIQVMSEEEYQKHRELKTLETQFALWQIANNAMRESWLRSLWESCKGLIRDEKVEKSETEFDRFCRLIETKREQLQTSVGESLENLSQYRMGHGFYFRFTSNAHRLLWQWLIEEGFPKISSEQLSFFVNRFADYYEKLRSAGYVHDARLVCLAAILAEREEEDILESFLASDGRFHEFLFPQKVGLHEYTQYTYERFLIEGELLDVPTLDVESSFYYFSMAYNLLGEISNQYLEDFEKSEYLKRAIVAARLVKGVPIWHPSPEMMKGEVEVRLNDLTRQCQRLQRERWDKTVMTVLDHIVGISGVDLIHLMRMLNLLDSPGNLENRLSEVKQELEIAKKDTDLAQFLIHNNLYYYEREPSHHVSIGRIRNIFAKELVQRFSHIRKMNLPYFGLKAFQDSLLASTPGRPDRLFESFTLVVEALVDWMNQERWQSQPEKDHIHRILSFLMLNNCYPQASFHDFLFELYAH